MDTALQTLLSWQFILFCVAVAALTYVIRIVMDYILQSRGVVAKECHWWVELVLPILPVVLGSVGAVLAKQYPFPDSIHSGSGRFVFGLCAGFLSGLVWRVVKATLTAKISALQPNQPASEANGASAGKVDE